MQKFRKKPVVVEAMRYDGHNFPEVAGFVGEGCVGSYEMNASLFIDTLEGRMQAVVGDWIVKGTEGEFYPCKPDAFEVAYEAVEE